MPFLLLKDRLVVLLVLVTIFYAFQSVVRADEDRPHQIAWGIGLGLPQYREDILVPLRWVGVGVALGAEYRYNNGLNRHQASLGFSAYYLQNRYRDEGVAIWLDMGYSYHRRLFVDDSIGEFWLGPVLRYKMHEQYYISWDECHLYWLTTIDLGPSAVWHKLFEKKHDIWVELQFPLVAVASRPPRYHYFAIGGLKTLAYHLSTINGNMRFTSLNEYISVSLKAEYLYKITESTEIGGSYEIGYRTFSEPMRFQELYQALTFIVVHRL